MKFKVIVYTEPGTNNDIVEFTLNDVLIWTGASMESRYSFAVPMNEARFELGYTPQSIGFNQTSPQGFLIDQFKIRVYNKTEPNNVFETGFEPPLCFENITNPCVNNGTCVAANNYTVCLCPAGKSGDVCQTDINECSSEPCENGGMIDCCVLVSFIN